MRQVGVFSVISVPEPALGEVEGWWIFISMGGSQGQVTFRDDSQGAHGRSFKLHKNALPHTTNPARPT